MRLAVGITTISAFAPPETRTKRSRMWRSFSLFSAPPIGTIQPRFSPSGILLGILINHTVTDGPRVYQAGFRPPRQPVTEVGPVLLPASPPVCPPASFQRKSEERRPDDRVPERALTGEGFVVHPDSDQQLQGGGQVLQQSQHGHRYAPGCRGEQEERDGGDRTGGHQQAPGAHGCIQEGVLMMEG